MGEELFMILRVTKTARAASAGDMLLPNEPTPKAFPRASRARVAMPRFGLRLLLWIPWSSSWRLDGRPSAITKRKTKTTGTSWKWIFSLFMYLTRNYLLCPIELGGLVNPVWGWSDLDVLVSLTWFLMLTGCKAALYWRYSVQTILICNAWIADMGGETMQWRNWVCKPSQSQCQCVHFASVCHPSIWCRHGIVGAFMIHAWWNIEKKTSS